MRCLCDCCMISFDVHGFCHHLDLKSGIQRRVFDQAKVKSPEAGTTPVIAAGKNGSDLKVISNV